MPIKLVDAPPPSFKELKAYLHSDPKDQSPHIPHKVYNINLDDLLAGKSLDDAAYLVAWRYIFRGEDQQDHVAEISVDEAKGHAFNHINSGSHVDNFIALYEKIQEHATVKKQEYEINILRVPACYVMAVWFKGANKHEFLVPLAPVHHKFVAGRHYETDKFMKLLKATASQMAANPAVTSPAAVNEDDLTRIEGIGPKTAGLLQAAGITTFAALANARPSDLQSILDAAGSRYNLADPATWPEQAALAAAGKWHELEKLKDELKGGRR